MPDAPTPNRTKVAAAAALLGAAPAVAAFVLGAGPIPSPLQLAGASRSDAAEDVSGNCDEAEHAADPECAGTPTSDDDDDATTSTTVDDNPADDDNSTTSDGVHSLDAGGAGTVIYAVEGGSLRLITATPASGWSVEVEQGTGREIELDFRSGTHRVQVNVEIEDGQVRERVRVRDDADDTDIRTEDGVVQDDNSGPGSGDEVNDDNSGPGSGEDDTADDDHSGSGHDGSDDSSDDSSGSGHSSDD